MKLIASNQITLTNVNDGQSIKENLFSATSFALTKYAHPTQPTILVSWKYNGKPNTKYTLSTDLPRNAQGTYDIFFGVYPSTPSSSSNGVAINEPRTITTDATGVIEITARMGTIADSIIAKTSHIKLEENDRMTAFIFHPDDQIGLQGPKGDSTGIAISDTEPSTKYVNMLWKHTGNVSGLITGATYRWTGIKWELYLFTAANITTENLAAITANLGTVTAGTVKGTTIEMSLDDNQIVIGTNNRAPNTINATEGLVIYGTNGYSSSVSSQGTVYELSSDSTLYQMWMEPSGLRFVYNISSSHNGVRYFNATSNGFEFKPTSDATGIGGNTGIDLKGLITYIDFHWEIDSTVDFRTRLQQDHGKFTIDSPYSDLFLKGGGQVRMLTPGVNVRNLADSAWAPVNASGFGQQSDSQYKYNIKDMPDRLNELMGLEFKAYRLWGEDGKYQEGLLADKNYQQPFVNRGKDGDYNIDMYGYTTFLAKSLQEAVKRLEILENASRNGQSSGTTIGASETTVAGERNAESS